MQNLSDYSSFLASEGKLKADVSLVPWNAGRDNRSFIVVESPGEQADCRNLSSYNFPNYGRFSDDILFWQKIFGSHLKKLVILSLFFRTSGGDGVLVDHLFLWSCRVVPSRNLKIFGRVGSGQLFFFDLPLADLHKRKSENLSNDR